MGLGKKKVPRKSVKDLKVNPLNPRTITDARLAQLAKSMDEYGDISGIVFNRRSGNLVGGEQRSKDLDQTSKVVITKRYDKPTKKGTVAVGYVLHKGERFAYREVDWNPRKETGAMLAANENAGEWDDEMVATNIRGLSSFDADFDMELTMFDDARLEDILGEDEEDEEPTKTKSKSPSKLVHECPRCGHEFR